MRFRRLSLDELKELHEEFIQFMSSNGVTGDDWKKIKEEEYDKAEKLIEIFSDIVIEKSLTQINYLEKREPQNVLFFNFKASEIELIGISSNDPDIDFTDDTTIKSLSDGSLKTDFETFKSTKKIDKNREDEIFSMLENGCLISSGRIFKSKAI